MNPSREDKAKVFSLFNQFKNELTPERGLNRRVNDKVLLVDGLNTFIRCWSANPTMNEDGLHTGGVAGTLKSIGYAIKLINPTRCVIIFDGDGGSRKRKQIYPEYKEHRTSKVRLNRTYEELSEMESEEANKVKQLVRLAEYLQHLPVSVLIADGIEADDTIAYCAEQYFKDSMVTIMSSDKDFLQLVTDRVKVWSPSKKVMYGPAEVLRDYGIHPNNFVLFRAMDGDSSDNIDGVKGVGFKTASKYFPFLVEPAPRDVKYMIEYAEKCRGKIKIYDKVIDGASVLTRNYALMQLKDTIATTISQLHINDCLNRVKIPRLERYGLVKLITEDKMWNNIPNHQIWLNETFVGLDSMAKSQL
jgi:5'-3' exonuclease